jgi:hypothetical protein
MDARALQAWMTEHDRRAVPSVQSCEGTDAERDQVRLGRM